jgi:signal transduction histidine kinase
MHSPIKIDIDTVQSITAVPTVMRVIAQTTGLRWVCVSRVTADAWTMCAVHDELGFGLVPGDEIEIANTFCDQVRRSSVGVVIDDVANDDVYSSHPVPKLFGFQSYFSLPVYRKDGEFFGTLCGLDPNPASLRAPKTLDTLQLFAELLSGQIDAEQGLSAAKAELEAEKQAVELREQFIAILGHDMRTPLASMMMGGEVIARLTDDERILKVAARIERSGQRIANLIDDAMDFTRSKMDGVLASDQRLDADLQATLTHVVAELRGAYPNSVIDADILIDAPVHCDGKRIAQLASNLIVNAIVHGAPGMPVAVTCSVEQGQFALSVSNAGAAIPPAVAARLFQPFWRGDKSTQAGGLGLGLYIADQIAKAHRGRLLLDSDQQRTIFTFSMSIQQAEAEY